MTGPKTGGQVKDLLEFPHKLLNNTLQRRFPQLVPSTRTVDRPLPVRVQHCLQKLEKLHGLTDLNGLSHFTIGELLGMKNFGRKSLIDLLRYVSPVILDHTASRGVEGQLVSIAVTKAAERLRAQPYSARVRCSDPRLRSEIDALLFIANSGSDDPPLGTSASVHAVAHRLAGRIRDNLPPERTLDAIRKIRYKIARARRLPLERELEEIIRAFVTGRSLDISLSFLGWSGHGPRTLQAVGNDFHITRERVRQITTKCSAKMRQVRPFTPTLIRTIAHISGHLPDSVDDIEAKMHEVGLTRSLFRIEGVISAAELLGASVPFIVEENLGVRTVVRHEDAGLAKSIIRLARKTVSHAGLGKVADLCDQVQEESGTSIGTSTVKRVLQSLPSLRWLDEPYEWFLLDDVARNHLVTLVTKVLSVAPRIHTSEMRAAMAGDPRGMGFAPPKSVVLEFCSAACKCGIDGDYLVTARAPSITEVLSEGERLIYSVLVDEGPLLHRSDFERKCIERGMNRSTFSNYLGKLPILARYGPGVYGLRGAPIAPGDVERCIPPSTKRLKDYGWTSSAMPWLAVELSSAAISSGMITVPVGVQRFIPGRYLLRMTDGSEVGTLVISGFSAWGLGPLFRRRGGEPGDVVLLTFDLKRREAAVRLGTEKDILTSTEGFRAASDLT